MSSTEFSWSDERDEVLLASVRAGDAQAYGVLWARHAGHARALAVLIAPGCEVDDLVAEAFARVLAVILAGGGPEEAFGPYLRRAIRRINIDVGRRYRARVFLTDGESHLDRRQEPWVEDFVIERQQGRHALEAWLCLPAGTRALLWMLTVEGRTPTQIAAETGVTANSVSSRGKRARERLRQAFLSRSVAACVSEGCLGVRRDMGLLARKVLGHEAAAVVNHHLTQCRGCAAAWDEITHLERMMRWQPGGRGPRSSVR